MWRAEGANPGDKLREIRASSSPTSSAAAVAREIQTGHSDGVSLFFFRLQELRKPQLWEPLVTESGWKGGEDGTGKQGSGLLIASFIHRCCSCGCTLTPRFFTPFFSSSGVIIPSQVPRCRYDQSRGTGGEGGDDRGEREILKQKYENFAVPSMQMIHRYLLVTAFCHEVDTEPIIYFGFFIF